MRKGRKEEEGLFLVFFSSASLFSKISILCSDSYFATPASTTVPCCMPTTPLLADEENATAVRQCRQMDRGAGAAEGFRVYNSNLLQNSL